MTTYVPAPTAATAKTSNWAPTPPPPWSPIYMEWVNSVSKPELFPPITRRQQEERTVDELPTDSSEENETTAIATSSYGSPTVTP